jgi:hypothetical protein
MEWLFVCKGKESNPKKKRVGQKTGNSKGGSLTAKKEIVPVGKAAKADAKALTTIPTAAEKQYYVCSGDKRQQLLLKRLS